jgi:hypothetical protein
VEDRRTGVSDRRAFPRLRASFQVRFGVCGGHRREVPGFTSDVSLGGLSFHTPETSAALGDHLAVEVAVPGYDEPLYFLGEVVWITEERGGYELGVRFDWIGQSDSYREKLDAFLKAHG